MSDEATRADINYVRPDGTKVKVGEFALEPDLPKGAIPSRVIDELVQCRRTAKEYVESYGKAIEAQAEKHGIKAGALKRYVNAVEADKLEEVGAETSDLERLLSA